MRFDPALLRKVVAIVVAALFVVAGEPGTMAMSAHRPAPAPTAASARMSAMSCCRDKTPAPQKERTNPCKGMVACAGVLGCYGLSAVAPVSDLVLIKHTPVRIAATPTFARGIVHAPTDPPPIA